MKDYKLSETGDLITPEGQVIPSILKESDTAMGRIWKTMHDEVKAGEAVIIPYDPTPTDDEKIAEYRAAVGRHIDQQAQAFGFDSIVTAVTYADEPADLLNQSYGLALRAWRSQCWEKCREVLATWQGGGAEPTVDELIASLPAFVAL